MYHIFIIHLLIERYLAYCYFLAIVSKEATDRAEQVSLLSDVKFFRQMLKCGVTGLYGRLIFSLLRVLDADFHNVCTSLEHALPGFLCQLDPS